MSPIKLDEGYVHGAFAERGDYFETPYRFLREGRAPVVGQRAEVQVIVNVRTNTACRLSVVVTEVCTPPSLETWQSRSPLLLSPGGVDSSSVVRWDLRHVEPGSLSHYMPRFKDETLPLSTAKARVQEVLGAVHGQRLVAYGYLHYDFFYKEDSLPFASGRIYELNLELDERKHFAWQVLGVSDVTDRAASTLPSCFKQWDQGRELGRVPSFNKWECEHEMWV